MKIQKVTAVCDDCRGKTKIQGEAELRPADSFLKFEPSATLNGFNLLASMGLHHRQMAGDKDKDEPQHAMFTLYEGDFVEGGENKRFGHVRTSSEAMLDSIGFRIESRQMVATLTAEYLAGRGKEFF